MTQPQSIPDFQPPTGVSRKRRGAALAAYLVLAFGLAWAVALPLWLGDGAKSPLFGVITSVIMYAPAAAVLVVILLVRPAAKGHRLRCLGMWPLRPLGRTLGFSAVCLVAPAVLVALSIAVAALCGWVHLDLVHFSGFARQLEDAVPAGTPLPPTGFVVLSQVVAIPIAAATVNAVVAFGEEVGWRGFLLPALTRLGTWPALLMTGAVWGLWHAPIILLGYNFNRTDGWGVLAMTAGSIAWGVLFGWLRLRTGSVWPAVFAHGGLNAGARMIDLVAADGTDDNPVLAGPFGAAGWIACAVAVLVLLLTGQFGRRGRLANKPAQPGATSQAPPPFPTVPASIPPASPDPPHPPAAPPAQ